MNRLLEVGFKKVGCWKLVDDAPAYELDDTGRLRNILYAFIAGDQVKYIGKTVQALATRMIGYRTPGAGQSTNIRNNANIKQLLQAGQAVEIYALPDSGLLHYGQFHLNLAAGLEDSLIAIIDPDWNGGRRTREIEETAEAKAAPIEPEQTFEVKIGATYYEQGFFNVPVHSSSLFGAHGQTIEIFCGDNKEPILGTINRNANTNGSPRIYGRRHLRDWFQSTLHEGAAVDVEILSPTSIKVRSRLR